MSINQGKSIRDSAMDYGFQGQGQDVLAPAPLQSPSPDLNNPRFVTRYAPMPVPAPLADLARSVKAHLIDCGQLQGMSVSCNDRSLHAHVRQGLDEVAQFGLSLDQAWLPLAHRVNTRKNGLADATLTALLQPLVTAIDAELAAMVSQAL